MFGNSGIFQTIGFRNALKNCWFLIKYSFKLTAKNSNIIKPAIYSWIYGLILRLIFIITIYTLLLTQSPYRSWCIIVLLITCFILIPYKFFFDVRQQARIILLTFKEIQTQQFSLKDSLVSIKPIRGKLRLVALMNMLLYFSRSTQKNQANRGIIGTLLSILFEIFEGIWDLIEHYLLPAVVIDQLSLKDTAAKLKGLKDHVPEALVGVFGIDFIGIVLRGLGSFIYLFFIIIGVYLGYSYPHAYDAHALIKTNQVAFNYLPLYFTVSISLLITSVIDPLYFYMKSIYFTIFYVIIEKNAVLPLEMKDELTSVIIEANKSNN